MGRGDIFRQRVTVSLCEAVTLSHEESGVSFGRAGSRGPSGCKGFEVGVNLDIQGPGTSGLFEG